MKKKITAFLLAMLMVCSLLPLGAVAAKAPEDDLLETVANCIPETNSEAITTEVTEIPGAAQNIATRSGNYSYLIPTILMDDLAAVVGQDVHLEFVAKDFGARTQAAIVEIYQGEISENTCVDSSMVSFIGETRPYGRSVSWNSTGYAPATYYVVYGTVYTVNGEWYLIDDSVYYFTFELTKTPRPIQSLCLKSASTDATVTSLNMGMTDDDYACYITTNPTNTTDERYFSVSTTNIKVAYATESDGFVYFTPVGVGTCKIVVYSNANPKKETWITVNVVNPATSISLDKTNVSMHAGDKVTLKATVQPAGTTDKVVWTSSNPTVAPVSNGVVTARYGGTATITATAGNYKATCQVKISQHEFTEVESELSCTTPDATIRTCKICGKVEEEIRTPALGHDWDDGTIVKEATEEENGLLELTCQRCGAKKQTVIPATGDACDGTDDCPSAKFTDAPAANNWAHAGIDFAVSRGLLAGTTDTTFAPAKPMQRAMLVAVLWRLDGNPEPVGTNTFKDVRVGSYYEKAVIWASENGIVAGVGQNRFNPSGNVTREQIAAFFFRYARFKDYDVYTRNDLSTFPDANTISAYAKDAMAWANAETLISGVPNGPKVVLLNPKGNATRAQVAAIMMRFCYYVSGNDLSDRIG